MSYHGDIALGDTIDIKFCTVDASGAPTQLAGTPVVSAYPDNSTTQITAGITLSVDFDSVTGLNNVRVAATGGNGYAAETNYSLVITTGTVDGTSVVGYVVGSFSIENRSAATPTEVRSEAVGALASDTYAEPGQEAPAATNTLAAKIGYLFKAWRNKKTQTSSQFSLYADDGTTVDQKASTSDDGTTFSANEIGSGP